jgi:hypothetical protein
MGFLHPVTADPTPALQRDRRDARRAFFAGISRSNIACFAANVDPTTDAAV